MGRPLARLSDPGGGRTTDIALALKESLPDEDLTILTDSLAAMTTLVSLRLVDFPLSLHSNPCRLLITHVVTLLNPAEAHSWWSHQICQGKGTLWQAT